MPLRLRGEQANRPLCAAFVLQRATPAHDIGISCELALGAPPSSALPRASSVVLSGMAESGARPASSAKKAWALRRAGQGEFYMRRTWERDAAAVCVTAPQGFYESTKQVT